MCHEIYEQLRDRQHMFVSYPEHREFPLSAISTPRSHKYPPSATHLTNPYPLCTIDQTNLILLYD